MARALQCILRLRGRDNADGAPLLSRRHKPDFNQRDTFAELGMPELEDQNDWRKSAESAVLHEERHNCMDSMQVATSAMLCGHHKATQRGGSYNIRKPGDYPTPSEMESVRSHAIRLRLAIHRSIADSLP